MANLSKNNNVIYFNTPLVLKGRIDWVNLVTPSVYVDQKTQEESNPKYQVSLCMEKGSKSHEVMKGVKTNPSLVAELDEFKKTRPSDRVLQLYSLENLTWAYAEDGDSEIFKAKYADFSPERYAGMIRQTAKNPKLPKLWRRPSAEEAATAVREGKEVKWVKAAPELFTNGDLCGAIVTIGGCQQDKSFICVKLHELYFLETQAPFFDGGDQSVTVATDLIEEMAEGHAPRVSADPQAAPIAEDEDPLLSDLF